MHGLALFHFGSEEFFIVSCFTREIHVDGVRSLHIAAQKCFIIHRPSSPTPQMDFAAMLACEPTDGIVRVGLSEIDVVIVGLTESVPLSSQMGLLVYDLIQSS